MKRATGWALLYLGLLLLPVAVGMWAQRAGGLEHRPWLDDWAAGLGMMGFCAVLLSFFLLGRFSLLSTRLGSDRLMLAHQLFARTAVAMLLLHPFFYTLWDAPPGPVDASAARALRIGAGDWGLATGLLALGALLALVATAIWRPRSDMAYPRWRLLHAGLALAVLGLGLHHTLVSGRYAQLPAVALLWWLLAAAALCSLLWVHAVRPLWLAVRPYRITRLEPAAERIWLLEVSPTRRPRRAFRAGQFAWIRLGHLRAYDDNPFSLSQANDAQGRLQFLIKEAGDMTGSLSQHRPGETVHVDGPHGQFAWPPDAPAIVMHAGGIGVAPFVALLADAVARGDPRPIRLIYADRSAAQMIDLEGLSGASALADFACVPMVERPEPGWQGLSGRLDAAGVQACLTHTAVAPWAAQATHMVCGPEPMMDAVESALVAHGVPGERIVSEHFRYDFAGRSPRSLAIRRAWWALSAASLLALALALALR